MDRIEADRALFARLSSEARSPLRAPEQFVCRACREHRDDPDHVCPERTCPYFSHGNRRWPGGIA